MVTTLITFDSYIFKNIDFGLYFSTMLKFK